MNKREEIIRIAADLFHQNSYNSVGLQKILNIANIPKGSFYYYFDSKEHLVVEVIHFFIDEMFSILEQFPKNILGLQSFFNAYFDRFKNLDFTRGCPLGNLALELSDSSNQARQCFLEWTTRLEAHIKQILCIHDYNDTESERLASFIVSAFEGVLLKAKIEKTEKPLEEFNYFIFHTLLEI